HHRVIVLEVMGRHAGWIATMGWALQGGGGSAMLLFLKNHATKSIKIRKNCGNI
ncbi:6-phosphofructokinase, partial [Thermoplasmatales archaeon SCGC AB-540-F20]